MAMIWTFERWIEKIHPPRRRGLKSEYCHGMEGSPLFTLVLTPERRTTGNQMQDGLDVVYKTSDDDSSSLLALFENDLSRGAYSLRCLDPENDFGFKKTVEFRQHEGTIDGVQIASWIRVCVGLVEFADTVDDKFLEWFCRAHVRDEVEDYSIGMFLNAVGLPIEAVYYSTLVDARKVEEEEQRILDIEMEEQADSED